MRSRHWLRLLCAPAAAVLLAACAAPAPRVSLSPPAAVADGNGVRVIDARMNPELNVATALGSGTGSARVDLQPGLVESLQRWLAQDYQGPRPLYVAIEGIDVTHAVGLATKGELRCGIESQVRVGGENGRKVRTQVSNTETVPPDLEPAVQLIVSQCLQAHAADIRASR